ncbi:MAG: hypothetical protein JNJ54_33590 [Myxococcaceae bacterium]|nr:hypothetical protein [Myxococcaceae bacterium]
MATLVVLTLLAQGDFTVKGVEDGVEIAWRGVPGSGYCELRFVATAQGEAPDALCARAFGTGKPIPGEPFLVSRTVLEERPDERLSWDVIAPPMVSRRDYVVRSVRTRSGGTCRVDFSSIDDVSRRPPEGVVRLKHLRGSFAFEALPGGRVRVEHRVHLDPGGWLTPALVEPSRERMSLAWMKRLLARE